MPTLLALGAISLAVANGIVYLRAVFRGAARPHAFTWGIWALISAITFMAQRSGGGGSGAWLQAYSTVQCVFIMLLALKRGDRGYTRSDWAALAFALAAIPLWLATGTPAWSVALLCVIDAAAFWPTFRKSWHKPREEPALPYILWAVAAVLSIAALDTVNFVTAAYPAFLVGINITFVLMLGARRRA